MDLLRTILIYLSMVFVSSVESAPEFVVAPATTVTPTAIVEMAATPTPKATASAVAASPTPVPTPDITPNNEYKTIKVGDNGENVTNMQRRLSELGYYTGDIDGRFGNQTRRAVERFQYNNGLSADGIAGKRTLTVLYESKDVVAFSQTAEAETPAPSSSGLATVAPMASTADADTSAPTFIPTLSPSPESGAEEPAITQTDTVDAENEKPEATEGTESTVAVTPEPSETDKTDKAVETAEVAEETEEPPTVDATELPEPSAALTDEPAPETSPESEKSEEVSPLEIGFVWEGEIAPMTAVSQEGGEPVTLAPLEKDQVVYVPFLSILENAGVLVIPSVTAESAEYAFAIGADFYHLSYELGDQEAMKNLIISRNGEPQIMEERTAFLQDGILYLPLSDMEKWTGILFELDGKTMMYTVFLAGEQE